jgi:hypothetical protein
MNAVETAAPKPAVGKENAKMIALARKRYLTGTSSPDTKAYE